MKESKDDRLLADLAEEALVAQDAVNLSGVVHAWSRSLEQQRFLEPNLDTDVRNQHAINQLFADKCADLARVREMAAYSKAYTHCKELAAGPKEGVHARRKR